MSAPFAARRRLMMGAGAPERLYVEDVFSTWTYTGNGATQTINNGIDLAGKGGLVWIKARGLTIGHNIVDSARGTSSVLATNTSDAAVNNNTVVTTLNSDGFTVGTSGDSNSNLKTYASWTFRKAPKFFDVVTWTGNGVAGRQIAHSLGIAPGMIAIKALNSALQNNWIVVHRSFTNKGWLKLNLTDAIADAGTDVVTFDAATFTVQPGSVPSDFGNQNGIPYVAYLFAHDTSPEGIIQCGSFATDGSGSASVTLSWEPQYLIVKDVSGIDDWFLCDAMRGLVDLGSSGSSPALRANLSNSEDFTANLKPTASGFNFGQNASRTYIYLAIRRGPMRVPTNGTAVFDVLARTGTSSVFSYAGAAFPPDMLLSRDRNSSASKFACSSRLRGPQQFMFTPDTAAEVVNTGITSIDPRGFTAPSDGAYFNESGDNMITYMLRRAPGFMDEVCEKGTGVARNITHKLQAVPELIIAKPRDYAESWPVWAKPVFDRGANRILYLNTNLAEGTAAWAFDSSAPTATTFRVGTADGTNRLNTNYVYYLFATLPGISKIGSYTGNGSSQTIDCGFAGGARFVMIKRIDAAGDWYVWDTARGIVAANDPRLSLNTTAAEVTTDDSVDPTAVGFIVNQVSATNINVNGTAYIYFAIA